MDLFWTTLVASISGTACALLGCFLLLKRMSMMGDALGHGILPGIVLAVMVTGQITSIYLFVGALVFGLLTALLIQGLGQVSKLSEDACQGIVSSGLFALGVLLINKFYSHRDLDLDCVFFGHLEVVPLHLEEVLPPLLVALGVTVAGLSLFWKELKLASFDAGLATALGYPAWWMHYGLIALVAGVSVVSFEAFGSVLVLAMLVVPPAIAHMLTDRLDRMLLWASLAAILSSVLGNYLAVWWNVSIAGTIGSVLGGMFLAAVLGAPRYGIVARGVRHFRLSLRMAGEDILAGLYRAEENQSPAPNLFISEHGFTTSTIRGALRHLLRQDFIEAGTQGAYQLTLKGREKAGEIVRAHRLWELFLAQTFQLPRDHLHLPASAMEHFLGPELQNQLAQELAEPHLDPHGKTIPPAKPRLK